MGGGFSLVVLLSLASKLIRSVLEHAHADIDTIVVVGAARTALQTLLTVVVAVGILLIPSSLEKQSKRA